MHEIVEQPKNLRAGAVYATSNLFTRDARVCLGSRTGREPRGSVERPRYRVVGDKQAQNKGAFRQRISRWLSATCLMVTGMKADMVGELDVVQHMNLCLSHARTCRSKLKWKMEPCPAAANRSRSPSQNPFGEYWLAHDVSQAAALVLPKRSPLSYQ